MPADAVKKCEEALGRALRNGFLEQSLGRRYAHQRHHALGSSRLSGQGDVGCITPEGRDVLAHPLKGCHLVQEAPVGRHAFDPHEPVDAHAVVDSHHHHPFAGIGAAVVPGLASIHAIEGAARQPDQDRRAPGVGGGPDVQRQIVSSLLSLTRVLCGIANTHVQDDLVQLRDFMNVLQSQFLGQQFADTIFVILLQARFVTGICLFRCSHFLYFLKKPIYQSFRRTYAQHAFSYRLSEL